MAAKMKVDEQTLCSMVNDYKDGMMIKRISEKYSLVEDTVQRYLKNVGVYKPKNFRWSQKDIEDLCELYPRGDWNAIKDRFPTLSKSKIHHKASELNLAKEDYFWSEHDKFILMKFYNTVDIKEIQKMLDKQYKIRTIQSQAMKLGLTSSRGWSDEEIKVLKDNYSNISMSELLQMLPGRTDCAISMKAREFNLTSWYKLEFYYTNEEKEYIRNHWETMSDEEMAVTLGKTACGIQEQRHKMNLYYPKLERSYYDLFDYIRHNNQIWRRKSMEFYNYKCMFTGRSNFEIHHIYSFNLIVKEVVDSINFEIKDINEYSEDELRYLLDNFLIYQNKYPMGACIDKNIHQLFHRIYGNKVNTVEQWDEFCNNISNHKYDNVIKNIS